MLNFGKQDIATYRTNVIGGAEFNVSGETLHATAYYSKYAVFSIPLTINILSNALLNWKTEDDYSIEISVHQLPYSSKPVMDEADIDGGDIAWMFVNLFYPAVALFVVHPHREYIANVKQLQLMTGVSRITYWAVMFVFDLFIFFALITCITIGLIFMDSIVGLRLYEVKEIC